MCKYEGGSEMSTSRCNLIQACEWIAFGWEPMTADEEFECGRIRPQKPFVDIDASKEIKASWEKYRNKIHEAANKILSALRAGKLQVKGKAKLNELISYIECQFEKGKISEADKNAQIKECEELQDNQTILPCLPPSLSENPDVIIAETKEEVAELLAKAQKHELNCKYVYSKQRAESLESKINPFSPLQIEFFTNGRMANSDKKEPFKHMIFTELEFSFPALKKLFPFKEQTIKERLQHTGYTTPYLEIALEVIEEMQITNDNQLMAKNLTKIFIQKLEQQNLPTSHRIASVLTTIIRLPKSQKEGLKNVHPIS